MPKKKKEKKKRKKTQENIVDVLENVPTSIRSKH